MRAFQGEILEEYPNGKLVLVASSSNDFGEIILFNGYEYRILGGEQTEKHWKYKLTLGALDESRSNESQ